MRVESTELGAYLDALEKAYANSPERFDQMMAIYLNRPRARYSLDNDLRTRFFNVVQFANAEGWTSDLVAASLEANPKNPELQIFARGVGLDPVPAAEAANLEKVITERSSFHDAEPFLAEFAQLINWTCRVAVPGSGGSGVLVADNLILTNYHVIEKVTDQHLADGKVVCVFDYKKTRDGTQISAGRQVTVTKILASRPYSPEDLKREGGEPASDALDYAVLLLQDKVGAQPLGSMGPKDPLGTKRGFLPLSMTSPAVKQNDPLIVVQHPQLKGRRSQEPVQLAMGTVLASPYEVRVRHNARTLGGSSGSPCFNADLEMVALHHAGDPVTEWQQAEWNQAIPIGRIIQDIPNRGGVPKFWSD
jgi:hypothetical protein